jgi:hypothetical protein
MSVHALKHVQSRSVAVFIGFSDKYWIIHARDPRWLRQRNRMRRGGKKERG